MPLFVLLALCAQAMGALDVPFAFEVRKTGADTNAGGFALGALIAAPTTPSVSNIATGGSVAANTYYFVYTYTDAVGETVISPQSSTTTSGTTSTITATSPSASTGAKTWSCYVGTTSGGPYFPQGTGLTIGSNRSITTTPPTTGTQPRGVDYSQQDTAQINVADGVANGTTTFTSATANFTGSHVGNLIRVGSSTWRHIVGVTNSTTITLDATVATNTGLPVVVGGAFLTPGVTGAASPPQKSILYLKYNATAYTMSASANVAGGRIADGPTVVVGYDTTRTVFNRDANRPKIEPSANSVVMFNYNSNDFIINNIQCTNSGGFTSDTFLQAAGSDNPMIVSNCKISGLKTCVTSTFDGMFVMCEVSVTDQSQFGHASKIQNCDWHDGNGIQLTGWGVVDRCNFYNITGTSTSYAVQLNSDGCILSNCNFYHCTQTNSSIGSAIQANAACYVYNCVIEDVNPASGSGYAFDGIAGGSATSFQQMFQNCFVFNIKTATANPANIAPGNLYGVTTLTASPFTNPGSGNFAPNSTAGGGAVIRGASLPTTFPAGLTANYLDAGAVQHLSAATPRVPHPRPTGQ